MNKRGITVLLKESLTEFSADNGTLLAASIAFNLIFSLCPAVFIVMYIAGHIPQWPHLQNTILHGIEYLMPVARVFISGLTSNHAETESTVGALALIGLIWGSISVFNSVRVSLNAACGTRKPHSIFMAQLLNIGMLLSAGVLLFLSMMISTWLRNINQTELHFLGIEFLRRSVATRILVDIPVTGLSFVVFLLLYKMIKSPRPKWKEIWLAALAAAVLFEITKVVFIWYIQTFSPYNLYGSIGSLIAFLMWIYLSALIFLFIAKINHVNLRMKAIAGKQT